MSFNNFCQKLKIKEEHKEDVKRYLTNFHGIITITKKKIGNTYSKNNILNIFKIGSEIKDGDDIFKLLEIIEINYNISNVSEYKTYLMKFHNETRNELYLLFHWGSSIGLLNGNNIKNKFTDFDQTFINNIANLHTKYKKILLFGHSLGGVMCQFIAYNICNIIKIRIEKYFMITTGAFCWMNTNQHKILTTTFENNYINIALCEKFESQEIKMYKIDEYILHNIDTKKLAINIYIYIDTSSEEKTYNLSDFMITSKNETTNINKLSKINILEIINTKNSLHPIEKYKTAIKYILDN